MCYKTAVFLSEIHGRMTVSKIVNFNVNVLMMYTATSNDVVVSFAYNGVAIICNGPSFCIVGREFSLIHRILFVFFVTSPEDSVL